MDIMGKLLASQSKLFITPQRGQQIEGEIVSQSTKEITLDIGAKSEGILQRRDLSEAKSSDLKIGDKLKVFVSQVENEHGQVVLSMSYQVKSSPGQMSRGLNKFIQAKNQKNKIQGKVLEVNKGGLIVEIDGVRGFLPNSQVGFELLSKASKSMEDLIGQSLTVTVTEVDQDNNKLIFSQRGQISDEIKAKLLKFKKDQKTSGKIVAILPFGLVVDVNGVEGLVFISDVSWERIEDLNGLYKVGDTIDVLVTGLDNDLGRLNLSIKHLMEDPFSKFAEKYPADEVVKAEITQVSEDGVVVKLSDGTEGFMRSGKMDTDTKYEIGKSLSFLVDGVDLKKRRINLTPFVTSTEGLIYK